MSDVKIYDIGIDETRAITQDDVDKLLSTLFYFQRMFRKISGLTGHLEPLWDDIPKVKPPFNFKLKVFPNPMREDGAFVCEDKPILPYEGIRGLGGESIYPAIPQGAFCFPRQFSHDFAEELVKRWNAYTE